MITVTLSQIADITGGERLVTIFLLNLFRPTLDLSNKALYLLLWLESVLMLTTSANKQ